MRALSVCLATWAACCVGQQSARADVVLSGLLRDETFLRVGGRTFSDFGFTLYPGEFEVETALADHSFSRATGYALPLGEGAVFGASSHHMTTYNLGNSESRNIVSTSLAVIENTTYELTGSLIALPDTEGGTIAIAVELQRWENNALAEILFHQTSWTYAINGARLDLGVAQGGDIGGSLTGALFPGQDYRLEATYTTDTSSSTDLFAEGQIDLFVGAVPSPGVPALFCVALAVWPPRRRRTA